LLLPSDEFIIIIIIIIIMSDILPITVPPLTLYEGSCVYRPTQGNFRLPQQC